jgi:hypothetical protein
VGASEDLAVIGEGKPQDNAPSSATPGVVSLGRRFGASSLLFILAKASVFFVPLGLSIAMDSASYGAVEYSMAWSSSVALMLGLGLPGSIPYFLLKRQRPEYFSTIQLFALGVGVIGVIAGLGLLAFPIHPYFVLGVFLTGSIVLQGVQSSRLKVADRPGAASFVESGIYLAMLVGLGVALISGSLVNVRHLYVMMGAWLLLLLVSVHRKFSSTIPLKKHFRRFRKILRFGVPLVLSSLFMALLTGGGRLIAGSLLSLEEVAVYSFFYRLCASCIVLHQLLTVLLFSRIYVANPKDLDRYFSTISMIVALCAALFCVSCSYALPGLMPAFARYSRFNGGLFWLLSLQMVFFAGIAQCEFIVNREKKAVEQIAVLAIAVGVGFLVCVGMKWYGALNLVRLCAVQTILMALVLGAQSMILFRMGIRVPRMLALILIVFSIFGASLVYFELKPTG